MSMALDRNTGSLRHARGDLCASIFGSPKPPDGGGAAAEEGDRNACAASSFCSPSCSSSSSIGKNSDGDLSGRSSDGGEGGEDEVQSSYKGSLDSVNDLEEALPMRRGISRFYNGKSKSFTSLPEATAAPCIKEIAKPENAYSRKRKNLMAFGLVWEKKGGISKRPLRPSRSTLALAVAMGSSDSISDGSTDSTSSSNAASPTAALPPLHPHSKASRSLNCSTWRSFSVADLQQCSGGAVANGTSYGGNGYGFFK